MNAISGTRRAMKELVDGTIRVQIDIDPTQRAAFHKLFGEIDMPVALAPLKPEAAITTVSGDVQVKEKPGPLCMLAVKWCKEPAFMGWLGRELIGKAFPNEEQTATGIYARCGIESRKELDTDPEAADKFQRLIRRPYVAYLEGKK